MPLRMRLSIVILCSLSIGCEAFAWWGLYTRAGRTAFDEMAGILPMAAFPLGILFALGALAVWYFSNR